ALLIQRRPGTDVLSLLSKVRHLRRPEPEGSPAIEPASLISRPAAPGSGSFSGGDDSELLPIDSIRPASKASLRRLFYFHRHQLVDRMVLSDLTRFFLFILG